MSRTERESYKSSLLAKQDAIGDNCESLKTVRLESLQSSSKKLLNNEEDESFIEEKCEKYDSRKLFLQDRDQSKIQSTGLSSPKQIFY